MRLLASMPALSHQANPMTSRQLSGNPATDAEPDPSQPTPAELAAIHHLARVALGSSGQGNRCANFLLAWADADAYGGFDLTDIWACGPDVIQDMVTVFGLVARVSEYPELLDVAIHEDMVAIAAKWRRQELAAAHQPEP